MTKSILYTFHVKFLFDNVYLFIFSSVALCLIYCSSNLEKRMYSFLEAEISTGFHFQAMFFRNFLFHETSHMFLVCYSVYPDHQQS